MPSEDSNFVQWLPLCERMAIFSQSFFHCFIQAMALFVHDYHFKQINQRQLADDDFDV